MTAAAKSRSLRFEISQKLYDFLTYNSECAFSIAISEVFDSIVKLPKCSASADNAVLYAISGSQNQIIYAGDLLLADDLFDAYENYQKQYSVMLSHGSDSQITDLIKNLFSLFESSAVPLPAIRQHCIRFASGAVSALTKQGTKAHRTLRTPAFWKSWATASPLPHFAIL